MTLPPKLQRELDELLGASHNIEVSEDPDFINLVFKAFQLGVGYNATESDLLLKIPRSYPDAGPDMFWVDPKITLASGQVPQSAEGIETHLGKQWRRFSWHRQGSPWNPMIDNMQSYIEFIRRRLREMK
jgi:hypothetical protein